MTHFKTTFISALVFGLGCFSLHAAERLSPEQVIKKYINKQGGEETKKNIKSVRASGTYTNKDYAFKITILKKSENKARVTLKDENLKIIHSYNGKTAWICNGNETPKIVPLESLDSFVRDAPIFSHLSYALEKGYKISLLGNKFVGEHDCYHLRLTLDTTETLDYYIDSSSFLERKMEHVTSDGGIASALYSDFRKVGTVSQPFKVENYKNNDLISTLEFSTMSINVGIPNYFFDPPKGTTN